MNRKARMSLLACSTLRRVRASMYILLTPSAPLRRVVFNIFSTLIQRHANLLRVREKKNEFIQTNNARYYNTANHSLVGVACYKLIVSTSSNARHTTKNIWRFNLASVVGPLFHGN